MLNVLDMFDISFDADDVLDLNSILSDLGIALTDFDSSVLDAER